MTLRLCAARGEKCEIIDLNQLHSTPACPVSPLTSSVEESVEQDYRQDHPSLNNPVYLDRYPEDPQSHSLQRITSNTSSNDSVNLASSAASTLDSFEIVPLVSSLHLLPPVTPEEELEPAVCVSPSNTASSTGTTLSSSITSDISTTQTLSSPATSRLVLDSSNRRTSRAIYTTSSGISKVQLVVKPAQIRTRAVVERRKWQIPFQIESTSSPAAITSSIIVEPPPDCQS